MRHQLRQLSTWALLGLFALLAAVLVSPPAVAQEDTCIDDVTNRTNVCSANDVELSYLISVRDASCNAGEPVTVNLQARLVATSLERFDIGIFLALDGGLADTGSCHHDYLPPPLAAGGTCSGPGGDECLKDADCPAGETCTGGYNPLSGTGPFYDAEQLEDADDACGDLEQDVDTYYVLGEVTVLCIDSDGDGYLDIGTALSWDNKKDNTCLSATDAVPNTRSKCRYGTVDVANVRVIPGAIQVTKTANPTELYVPGGPVTFSFTVQNNSAITVTLSEMSDSVYGPLEQAGGDCTLPQTLGPAGTYACSITADVTGDPGVYRDTVTVTGADMYGTPLSATATAEVLLVGLVPDILVAKVADPETVQEPGGEILYSVTVTNESGAGQPVTLTGLTDDIYGNLTDPGNLLITASTCQLVTIEPQQQYTCTFRAAVSGVSGNTIVDTVTAAGVDDLGQQVQASNDATVTIFAEPPDTGIGTPAAVLAGGALALGLGLLLAGVVLRRRMA